MKVEFLNPFVYAWMRVLASEAGVRRQIPGKPDLIKSDATLHAVNVVVGVEGSIDGLVIYGLDLSMAKAITRALGDTELPITDPMADSILSELGNVITGQAAILLEEAGYPCRISTPVILKGTGIRLTTRSIPMVSVPIATDVGDVTMYLSLNERQGAVSRRA